MTDTPATPTAEPAAPPPLTLRCWQLAGQDVIITLARLPTDLEDEVLQRAVHAFSRFLTPSPFTVEERLARLEAMAHPPVQIEPMGRMSVQDAVKRAFERAKVGH